MRALLTILLIVIFTVPNVAQAKTNILLIVDGSNSMWGQIDNTAKVETARKTLGKLISELPADADLALMAYGHTREGDCNDVELLSAMGKNKPEIVKTLVHTIQPTGKTPIANALAKAKDAFKGLEGQNNHVLLVSDGIESCDGDPCAVAKGLQEAGLNVSAHVVGFGVSKEEGKQLTCIAENTGGKYFDVADAAAFSEAIEEVKKVAEAPPPPKAEPVLYFEDNFEGDDLAEHWEVINPNPEAYIVEDGALSIVAASEKPLIGSEELENTFRLTEALPEGDWTAILRITPEISTFRENYTLALYKDKDNMLAATATVSVTSTLNGITHKIIADKVSKGAKTSFNSNAIFNPMPSELHTNVPNFLDWAKNNIKAFYIRIEKSGRNYVVSTKVEGDLTMADGKEPQWVAAQKLTSLRPPGDSLVIALRQNASASMKKSKHIAGGESLGMVDWIKIETMQQPEATQPAAGE